jgi:hypothetical protein
MRGRSLLLPVMNRLKNNPATQVRLAVYLGVLTVGHLCFFEFRARGRKQQQEKLERDSEAAKNHDRGLTNEELLALTRPSVSVAAADRVQPQKL